MRMDGCIVPRERIDGKEGAGKGEGKGGLERG